LSDINIHSPSHIQRAQQNTNPKHVEVDPSISQLNFMAEVKYVAEQSEEFEDEQYEPPEEIDIDEQNPNLFITSDHEYNPFERPSCGGMFVYLNAILKWYDIPPEQPLL
jgi:hypothetical protein